MKSNDADSGQSDDRLYFDGSKLPGTVQEEKEQDGGEIPAGPPRVTAEPRGKTRDKLAIRLLWLLALLIILHDIFIGILICTGKAEVKVLETAFNSELPVIAGLLGTAVAFYFKSD